VSESPASRRPKIQSLIAKPENPHSSRKYLGEERAVLAAPLAVQRVVGSHSRLPRPRRRCAGTAAGTPRAARPRRRPRSTSKRAFSMELHARCLTHAMAWRCTPRTRAARARPRGRGLRRRSPGLGPTPGGAARSRTHPRRGRHPRSATRYRWRRRCALRARGPRPPRGPSRPGSRWPGPITTPRGPSEKAKPGMPRRSTRAAGKGPLVVAASPRSPSPAQNGGPRRGTRASHRRHGLEQAGDHLGDRCAPLHRAHRRSPCPAPSTMARRVVGTPAPALSSAAQPAATSG